MNTVRLELGNYDVDGQRVHCIAYVRIALVVEDMPDSQAGRFLEDVLPRVMVSLRKQLATLRGGFELMNEDE
jgi:hypothetical protein